MNPTYVDLALALIAAEGAALLVWRRLKGHGPQPAALIANLLSGAFLLIVVRALLTGANPTWTLAALAAALAAHACDLAVRWERSPEG